MDSSLSLPNGPQEFEFQKVAPPIDGERHFVIEMLSLLTAFRSSTLDPKLWRDLEQQRAVLEAFAITEEDGGHDLLGAAERCEDPELRGHLERHARDELNHAEGLRARARELAVELGTVTDRPTTRPYDLSRGRAEVNAHGFTSSSLYDEMGQAAYIAMLHVAEKRAASLFESCLKQLDPGDRTYELFRRILRDEKYHVAWTGTHLEHLRQSGRAREVDRALRMARGSRALRAWKRLGAKSAAHFARAALYILYYTLLAPIGLLARRGASSAPGELEELAGVSPEARRDRSLLDQYA